MKEQHSTVSGCKAAKAGFKVQSSSPVQQINVFVRLTLCCEVLVALFLEFSSPTSRCFCAGLPWVFRKSRFFWETRPEHKHSPELKLLLYFGMRTIGETGSSTTNTHHGVYVFRVNQWITCLLLSANYDRVFNYLKRSFSTGGFSFTAINTDQ